MKRVFITGLLALACLGGSAVALSGHSTRGASDTYKWEIGHEDGEVVIYRSSSMKCFTTVLVHVKERYRHHDDIRGGLEQRSEGSGVILEGCGWAKHVFVGEGQTVRCSVEEGRKGLRARAKNCEDVKGTVQEIEI